MKHLKLLNILIVMLLLTAWAPAPSQAAALVAPVLDTPKSGTLATSYQPTFTWKQPAYTTVSFDINVSMDSTFKNLAKSVVVDNTAGLTYTPALALPSNVTVYWRVRAVTDTTTSAWSKPWSLKMPPYPINFIIGPTGGVNVHTLRPVLSWDTTYDSFGNVLRTNKFNVQVIKRATNATVKSATVIATSEIGSYAFTSDLLRDTEYGWRVRADGLYADSPWTEYQYFLTANPPSTPVLLGPANGFVLDPAVNGGIPTLTWKASTSTKTPPTNITYRVQISTDSKFLANVTEVGPTTDTTTSPPTAPATGTYYWRVMAVDTDGDMSNWSLVRTVKTWPSLTITVQDYLTKAAIPDVDLLVTGMIGTLSSGPTGTLKIDSLKPGSKYVTATKADYVTKKVSVSVVAGVAKTLVIELVHVPMYVKLYWTDKDQNLDLHLWVPRDFYNPTDNILGHIMADHKGSTTKAPYAKLSADVLKGSTKAVETITIQNRYPGKYVIGVYSYNKSPFFGSGAKVQIFIGKTMMTELLVPAVEGNNYIWWHVADINAGAALDQPNQIVNDSPGPYDPDGGTFAIPGQ